MAGRGPAPPPAVAGEAGARPAHTGRPGARPAGAPRQGGGGPGAGGGGGWDTPGHDGEAGHTPGHDTATAGDRPVTDTDVLIIGAGLAGLGAAAALRQAGRHAVVLEASGRVGGRAWTAYPEALGGAWFDIGAVWFHSAEHNPLVPIALAAGDRLLRSDELRRERTFIGSRLATPAELIAYQNAWPRFEAMADRLLAAEGDVKLAEITSRLLDDPWARTIEAWEGPVICAADADRFSARDWCTNALDGSNLVPDGG